MSSHHSGHVAIKEVGRSIFQRQRIACRERICLFARVKGGTGSSED